jgi:hypothetical protein
MRRGVISSPKNCQKDFHWRVTRSNDAGGEVNGSAAGARDTSGCDSGAVHPAKVTTARTPIQIILTNAFPTVRQVAEWI